ncbi:MAG: hypothetical protein ACRBDI_08750 [Alphaproteobacteria bacterium]
MADVELIPNIQSKFADSVGNNDGIVELEYNIERVSIVLQQTEKGCLVHEPVGVFSGEGTGNIKSDAVKYYSNEDFADKIGDNFVTLKQYTNDMKGMEAGSVVNDTFLLTEDLDIMKDRLTEVGRDMAIYQNNLSEKIQDLQQRSPLEGQNL